MIIKNLKSLPIYTVDAFVTEEGPFSGNPAGVCLIPYGTNLEEERLQKIALEMNLSETAFVQPLKESEGFDTGKEFNLRWFTPTVEIALCGHGTIATGHIILNVLNNPSKEIQFRTMSGLLTAKRTENEGEIAISLPAGESVEVSDREELVQMAEASGIHVNNEKVPIESVHYSSKSKKLFVHVKGGRAVLESIKLNINDVVAYTNKIGLSHQSFVITSEDEECDFVLRVFCPWVGINEDPVTGSAQCILTPYWSKVLGKTELMARQCSARGGILRTQLDSENKQVVISGNSVVFLEGKFYY
ncbi:Diaminopimelate epimerase-like protein [Basidiobolus meristosporus CBS 931.73]|uniref:Diaminopimelate epimerase-like protein n=1 Tax=Basidiobolus meristosporus CBS 931.73 TaxID=1314790 RepID=A0A1Y1Y9S0_9FUNG|nr:Diaminopimelate epimerase-like protein [Basidiobolus meristosporus CBS 931.73]|eukprot:ORX94496.1 Diaminopimelate epimerase-like protein [Basidiobolus meristosporus CBS 931.73]